MVKYKEFSAKRPLTLAQFKEARDAMRSQGTVGSLGDFPLPQATIGMRSQFLPLLMCSRMVYQKHHPSAGTADRLHIRFMLAKVIDYLPEGLHLIPSQRDTLKEIARKDVCTDVEEDPFRILQTEETDKSGKKLEQSLVKLKGSIINKVSKPPQVYGYKSWNLADNSRVSDCLRQEIKATKDREEPIPLWESGCQRRRVIAHKDIPAGQVLALEDFPIQVPLWAGQKQCCHCLDLNSGLPIPCQGCRVLFYCSWNCQEQAWKHYHK